MRNTPAHLDPNAMHVRSLWGKHVGEDAFVVGTGSSLFGFDFARLADRLTIALNDAVLIPGLDPTYHLFVDEGIWKRYVDVRCAHTIFACSGDPRQNLFQDPRVTFKERIYQFNHVHHPVMALDDDLFCRNTVATAGIQMAWKLGARRIMLLGVDGYKRADRYYWNGSAKRPEKRREKDIGDGRIIQDRHENWQRDMRELRNAFLSASVPLGPWPGSGVYNLNPISTIDAWEKAPIEEALSSRSDRRIDLSKLQQPDMPPDEMAALVRSIEIASRVAGSFVEIGVKRAWSTVCVLQVLNAIGEARRVLSVDPAPTAVRWYRASVPAVMGACRAKIMAEPSFRLAPRMREPIAWLLLDGCHCERCVTEDLASFGRLVVPGGVIVLHDTALYPERNRKCLCFRTGSREPVRAGKATRESPILREKFDLIESIEEGRRPGIRVYRRRP